MCVNVGMRMYALAVPGVREWVLVVVAGGVVCALVIVDEGVSARGGVYADSKRVTA